WFDIDLWITAVDIVTDRIVEIDPENEDEYRSNADDYKQELREADSYAEERFADIPEEQRVLISSHDAFGYLADRYGLETRGVLGLSTEDRAGISEIEELAAFIADRDVGTVFQEDIADDQAAVALEEAVSARGGSVVVSDSVLYTGSLGESGDAETFIGAFRHNVDTIVNGLTR
ncbi:MAG: metal ABC transporter solute-binding protein, Zn/Mn family, partial [Spirochaetales bacterium]